ncbi:MAG: hypothetical protein HY393_04300 [Candidatus Diapherotrites archaeon]|nr:hypothetical protein [Candidatus Diapherotrites archaeon]
MVTAWSSGVKLGIFALALGLLVVAIKVQQLNAGESSPSMHWQQGILAQNPAVSLKVNEGASQDFPSHVLRKYYFKEVLQPKRNEYQLLERASEFLKVPISTLKKEWGIESEEGLFSRLPGIPIDFSETVYALRSTATYASISESYYEQPEFYPSFLLEGILRWAYPSPSENPLNGYEGYAIEEEIPLEVNAGKSFSVDTYWHAAYGVKAYQGFSLVRAPNAPSEIKVQFESSATLLAPAWPVFEKGWAQKVRVKGSIHPSALPGLYTLELQAVKPAEQEIKNWKILYGIGLPGKQYTDAATQIPPAQNSLKVLVRVRNKEGGSS